MLPVNKIFYIWDVLHRTVLLYIVFSIFQIANAEIYKWVDEHGNTHYTQNLPPVESEVIKLPPKHSAEAALKALDQQEKNVDQLIKERTENKSQKKQQEQDQAKSKALCDQSKARLASYQRPRVRVQDKNNDSKILGEDERQAEIEKSRDSIQKHCGT